MKTHRLAVETGSAMRLDVYLARRLRELSRSHIQKLIEAGDVLVNGSTAQASHKVQAGQLIELTIPDPRPARIAPEDIPLDVIFEDEHVIVINKPRGMTVHPAPGSTHGTLVNAVLAHSHDLSGIGGEERPGIVHRLDKDTSGLLVVAKTDPAHAALQKQIQARTAERRYLALVWGETSFNHAVVDAPIGRHPTDRQKMAIIKDTRHTARQAITHLSVEQRFQHFTLLEAKLDTGRTHQIRVHCSFVGHPLVGDPVYGGTKRSIPSGLSKLDQGELARLIHSIGGQALHAYRLSFDHPASGQRITFQAPLPADMNALLEWLRLQNGARET